MITTKYALGIGVYAVTRTLNGVMLCAAVRWCFKRHLIATAARNNYPNFFHLPTLVPSVAKIEDGGRMHTMHVAGCTAFRVWMC